MSEWAKTFLGTDACVAPILSMTEAPSDPHLAARGTFTTAGGVVQPAPAPRFSADAGSGGGAIGALPAGAIAPIGAHTRAVLTDLGFADVEELLSGGAVLQA